METEMANPSILSQFSTALSELAEGARGYVAAVRTKNGDQVTGVQWTPNTVVVSEQALPDATEFEVTIGETTASAQFAGRDEGTNVALLKLDRDLPGQHPAAAAPRVAALALALGAGAEGLTARVAFVRSVSGPWQSLAGGTIDQRILLDTRLGSAEEGGPVL